MNLLRLLVALVAVLITMPIWYFLMYKILVAVNASDLMWFLYWVYLPFGLFTSVVLKVIEEFGE